MRNAEESAKSSCSRPLQRSLFRTQREGQRAGLNKFEKLPVGELYRLCFI